jgi:PAS domain S-box-containing protein
MNSIVLLNIISALMGIISLVLIFTKTPARTLLKDYRCLVILLVSIFLFTNLSNILEWMKISSTLDTIEDHLLVLEAITFGVIFYSLFQKHLIAKIQDSEMKYRLIIENQTDLVVKVDTNNKFTFVSPSYCKMFDKTQQELIGKEFSPLVHKDDIAETLKQMENLYQPPYTCICTQRAKTIDGWRWITWADKAILNEAGNVLEIVGVGRDVTEQVEAELEREQLIEKVHSKNTEMQRIVSVASHDLKSPLVNILGFNSELKTSCRELTELLEKYNDPDLQNEFSRIDRDIQQAQSFIENGAMKMQSLVDGLLAVSRIGTQEIRIDHIVMDTLLENILQSMNYQIQDNNVRVMVEKLPDCVGDPRQINQVFSNLIDNAIKYRHPDRDLEISISGVKVGGHCQYKVSDNGIGIQKEHLEKIFEIYHRLNTQAPEKGHGLGLTIVSRVLERHGGSIRVESEYDTGSAFIIRLPANKTD